MQLERARILALSLLEKHELYDWTFRFDRAKVRFGCCRYAQKIISLSKILTELNEEDRVRDTILHEIAHAIVGKKHNHDAVWKAKAKEIGARPVRCYSHKEVVMPQRKYTAICSHCQESFQMQRKRNIACGPCCKKFNRGKYTNRFRIRFVENRL